MKKFLSCLSIITILTMFSPAFAAQPPGGGHGGPGRGGAGVHAPARRTPPPPAIGHKHHRHHTAVYAGFARPGYWYYSGYGYPMIEPYDDFFYPPYRVYRPYRPSYGFYINF